MSPRGTDAICTDAPSVLLADDADRLRSLYRAVLEDDGRFEVVAEAADGEEAIDAASQHAPDLVLLDLSMPRLDGLEALEGILDVSPDSHVIVLSGFEEDRFGDQARKLGAIGYIEKGGSPEELVGEIDDIVDGKIDLADRYTDDEVPTPPSEPLGTPVEEIRDRVDEIVAEWPRDTVDGPLRAARRHVETLRSRLEALARLRRVAGSRPDRQRVPLDDVVDDVRARLDGDLDDATLRGDDLPPIEADPDQLEVALAELVDNAVTFGSASTVEIRAAETEDGWRIVVADDGDGIPETHLDDALTPLETTGDPRTNPGIGLALVHHVAVQHGGDVRIDDVPDGGASVTMTLAEPDTAEGPR